MTMKTLYPILFLLVLVSCQESGENNLTEEPTHALNQFNDAHLVQIYDWADKRMSDSLLTYFDHENEKYRASAAVAFASIQDTLYKENLIAMLEDESEMVRSKTAWALAQTDGTGVFEALRIAYESDSSIRVRNFLLEAMGKTAEGQDSVYFAAIENVEGESQGYAAGLYAMAYKGIRSQELSNRAMNMLEQSKDEATQLYLSQYVSRAPAGHLSENLELIHALVMSKLTIDSKAGVIYALGRLNDDTTKEMLEKIIALEENPKLLVSALRAYSSHENTSWRAFSRHIDNPNQNVALAAIGCISNSNFNPKDEITNRFDPEHRLPARVEAKYLEACDAKTPATIWVDHARERLRDTLSAQDRSFYYSALSMRVGQFSYLLDQFKTESELVAKTACIQAMLDIHTKYFLEKDYFNGLVEAVFESKDVGAIAMLCYHIRNNKDKEYYLPYLESGFFHKSMDEMDLPTDMETYLELAQTIAYLKGEEYEKPESAYNNPIDWELIKTIPQDLRVVLETTKGDITIQLDVNRSPGSVSNFVELVNSNFLVDKTFHRVVPNFVIQSGCTRGDGYGSVDFTIRSEFEIHRYSSGAVGMASAGKDTESCQWFITHVPTAFLEGRYSIFAYVVDGMDVVNAIQVGDLVTASYLKTESD